VKLEGEGVGEVVIVPLEDVEGDLVKVGEVLPSIERELDACTDERGAVVPDAVNGGAVRVIELVEVQVPLLVRVGDTVSDGVTVAVPVKDTAAVPEKDTVALWLWLTVGLSDVVIDTVGMPVSVRDGDTLALCVQLSDNSALLELGDMVLDTEREGETPTEAVEEMLAGEGLILLVLVRVTVTVGVPGMELVRDTVCVCVVLSDQDMVLVRVIDEDGVIEADLVIVTVLDCVEV
jgi:hypothetical protein